MTMTTQTIGKPNWLLYSLLIASIGIHAFLLAHIARLYNSRDMSYIELEMRTQEKLPGRSIPVPPKHPKIKPPSGAPVKKLMSSVPVERPVLPQVTPLADPVHPSVVEPIAIPKRPNVSNSKILTWSPVGAGAGTKVTSSLPSSADSSTGDYFSMVRMMIEKHKQYPYVARRRRIQGRVVVHFVIKTNGRVVDVSVLKSSGYRSLDKAALEAVKASSPFPRPPAGLFDGPVPLEIRIVFELM